MKTKNQIIRNNRYLIDPYKSNGTKKSIKHNYYLSILLTSNREKKNWQRILRANLGEAGFSPLSFREEPAARYSKFFQASIGKHLNNQQLTRSKRRTKRPVVRAEPIRTSAASQRPRFRFRHRARSGTVTILEEKEQQTSKSYKTTLCMFRTK